MPSTTQSTHNLSTNSTPIGPQLSSSSTSLPPLSQHQSPTPTAHLNMSPTPNSTTTTNTILPDLPTVMLLLNFQQNEASRLLDGEFEKTWTKRGNILLSSLQQHRPVPPPGNGCGNTGNGGNPCVSSKKVAGRRHDDSARPPPILIHSTSADH
ncbi:hypothetical protein E3N88_33872 [Mikania micrantha]|uniref:Uncharacterized protein n=1 Tax=Mikania micrantha TaxID=192012 RepID=A0A5N6MDZ7_9ASTR|nr:hypothetical protein E3N88_33872 [Mikania micrantha]